ncbi:hypothetical protein BU23DRAFT_554587 [Bimuria novae-zelandiae CBS 107.79]|uniref:Uncharacterized protein n=1 Tax=Bimuria novae-zelandiae CBS 107.79 TaxID=1447943 RepID=A0A6A5V870_9PLEO|nr:hypothetical protein BU23DRAFT_554587 [Bimuria novae-zelandiae CBS 107.79]
MPPKFKSKAKAKTNASNPQSEIEFLEAAEEFEQAGGKWRAGDPEKAARFFQRASQAYEQGLQRFPDSFDLAYNKAHLEYEICEDERVAPYLHSTKTARLQETLTSHRRALALNSENLDIQFNTGQVLSSLAEAFLENETEASAKISARAFLEEAVELFTNCLVAQQQKYEQISSEIAELQSQANNALSDSAAAMTEANAEVYSENDMEASSASSTAGEWATIEEPLTPEVILETCTAQLSALTTLIGLFDLGDLPALEQRAKTGLFTVNTSIPTLVSLQDTFPMSTVADEAPGPTLSITSPSTEKDPRSSPKHDALLAAAIFQVAVAEVSYRSGSITSTQYANTVSTLFSSLMQETQAPEQKVAQQSAYADALLDVAEAVADTSPDVETQWNALSQAQHLLTQLCTPPNSAFLSAGRLADVFIARAVTDLVRFNMSLLSEAKPAWKSSRNVLISNCGVFYRGAKSYAEKAGNTQLTRSAGARAIVTEVLKQVNENGTDVIVAKAGWEEQGIEVKRVLEQMVNEKILGKRDGEEVLRIVTQ